MKVLSTPTLADELGVNTTRPFGIREHPKNLAVAVETNAQLLHVRATGSIIPTLDASAGQHIMLPLGKRVPP